MSKTLDVSEIFDSFQGEGPSAGAPATFLRLAGCNLRCSFCDTEYSWNWKRFSKRGHLHVCAIPELVRRLSGALRLVITGGEPLLQQSGLDVLLQLLPSTLFVEVETNGTISPSPWLAHRVDQWNVSPKLENSGESETRRLSRTALAELVRTRRAFFKFVVTTPECAQEIERLADALGLSRARLYVQAQARTRSELDAAAPLVLGLSRQHGFEYSPRLHIEKWDGARGR